MDPDTDIGGPLHKFPVTNHSAIVRRAQRRSTHTRRRAFDTILASYWKPAYKYIRLKWQADNEDAKDLTQGFFANAFEKNHFASYDAGKASFQTFLRTCLDGFVANERKAGRRLKRGGDMDHYQLDFATAETELAAHAPRRSESRRLLSSRMGALDVYDCGRCIATTLRRVGTQRSLSTL